MGSSVVTELAGRLVASCHRVRFGSSRVIIQGTDGGRIIRRGFDGDRITIRVFDGSGVTIQEFNGSGTTKLPFGGLRHADGATDRKL